MPLLGTAILIGSGITMKYAHLAVQVGRKKNAVIGLMLTITYGVLFMRLQAYEYY